jgi:hypothetical protein
VERLRIELAREGLDLRSIERMPAAGEALADLQILEIQTLRHDLALQNGDARWAIFKPAVKRRDKNAGPHDRGPAKVREVAR